MTRRPSDISLIEHFVLYNLWSTKLSPSKRESVGQTFDSFLSSLSLSTDLNHLPPMCADRHRLVNDILNVVLIAPLLVLELICDFINVSSSLFFEQQTLSWPDCRMNLKTPINIGKPICDIPGPPVALSDSIYTKCRAALTTGSLRTLFGLKARQPCKNCTPSMQLRDQRVLVGESSDQHITYTCKTRTQRFNELLTLASVDSDDDEEFTISTLEELDAMLASHQGRDPELASLSDPDEYISASENASETSRVRETVCTNTISTQTHYSLPPKSKVATIDIGSRRIFKELPFNLATYARRRRRRTKARIVMVFNYTP